MEFRIILLILLLPIWAISLFQILNKVAFPIITKPRIKNGCFVYNQPIYLDLFYLLVLLIIMVSVVISSFKPWYWENLFYLPVFIFEMLYAALEIYSKKDGEITIEDKKIKIRTTKSISETFTLKSNNVEIYKKLNDEESINILFWKKIQRVYYLKINNREFNLEKIGLDIYAIDIIRKIKLETGNNDIDNMMNKFDKYYGIRWFYTVLFILTTYFVYILN